MKRTKASFWFVATVTIASLGFIAPSLAEQIVIADYGASSNAMVYAVALEKGFFKKAGADVTGILSSSGGGTTIRNLMAEKLSFGDAALQSVIQAIQKGADLKIVSAHNLSAGDMSWMVLPNSPIKTLQDVKGKKIGYTNPGSGSQSLDLLMLESLGLTPKDVELVKCGGLGEIIVALNNGIIDIAPVYEPSAAANANKYRILARAGGHLKPLTSNVGFTTGSAAATRGDFIRGVIEGRRMALEYIGSNPDDSSAIVAKVYRIEPDVAKRALGDLLNAQKLDGKPYFSPGNIKIDALDNAVNAMKIVGSLSGELDWKSIIDESFLPGDLKGAFK